MSLFGEVMNPGTGRNNDVRDLPVKFIKVGAAVVGLLIAAVIFFNYVASVTRIGAGYVGVEIVLSGSQRGRLSLQRGTDLRRTEGRVSEQGAGFDPAEDGIGRRRNSAVRFHRSAAGPGSYRNCDYGEGAGDSGRGARAQ